MKRLLVCVLAIGFLLSSCGAPVKAEMDVSEAWARPAAQGDNGAVYFVIRSSAADEIVGASSDVAEAVEIHESTMSGDVMEMHHAPALTLGAGEQVTFEPGGLHIMLVNLKQDLEIGDEIELTLHFKNFRDIQLHIPVQDTPAMESDHELIQ